VNEGGLALKSLSIAKRDLLLMATNVATGVVVARLLGPAILGVWVVFQLILSYAEAFGRPRFDQAAVYYVGRRIYGAGVVAFTINVAALASSVVIVAVAAVAFESIYGLLLRDAPDVHGLLWLVLAQIPLQFIYLNYAYLHISRENVHAYNRMTVWRSISNAVLTVIALAVLQLGLTGVVLAMLASTVLGIAYGAIRFHRDTAIVTTWDWKLVRDLGGYGSRMYVAGAVGQLNNQLTNAICAVYLPSAELAYFSIASARRDVMNLLPNAVNTILFPRISSLERADAARLTALSMRLLLVTMLGVGVGAAALIRPVVALLYGAQYLPVVQPFLLLVPAFVVAGAMSPALQYFLGIGRPDLTVKVGVPAALLQLALAAWLVPAWSLIGAAIALAIPLLFGAILGLVVFLRLSELGIRDAVVIRVSDIALLRDIATRELRSYRGRARGSVTAADEPASRNQ
jgi:O-antigen/teichoic acid export membrane protein